MSNKKNSPAKQIGFSGFGLGNTFGGPGLNIGFQNQNRNFQNQNRGGFFGNLPNFTSDITGLMDQFKLAKNRKMQEQDRIKAANIRNQSLQKRGLLPPTAQPQTPLVQTNKNSMEYNNISQKAFTNTDNIKGMMGEIVPNTFNRKVGSSPLRQEMDPIMDPMIDPMMDAPLTPPNRIKTPITPPYDLNNY